MAHDEVLAQRIKTPARRGSPLEFWTWSGLAALIRDDQAGFELLPASATPDPPRKGRVAIFARDNGAGKTQLCVIHPSGEVGILYTEA
jgi:hypothetical protein